VGFNWLIRHQAP